MATRWFALLRAVVVSTLFVSIWVWLVPVWLARRNQAELLPERWWAIVPMTVGGVIMLRCIWDFAWRGLGTPLPLDPPRRLVVDGLYRWVRNPMYVGMGIFLIGEALLFPAITRDYLLLLPILWAIVTAFVMAYEEPTLRRLFGADYEEYLRNVGRWVPRVRPYTPTTK
ncbi:MAG TPA: isoprenylcysteine carboxylmethyltransferase family protein [Thermoanaerobaculia bacterium]|nr:isoprenylcysteine carboxylmethyltransferase family protein [Thermoanaerobaculia bacterium]